jgi:hypothetical protein
MSRATCRTPRATSSIPSLPASRFGAEETRAYVEIARCGRPDTGRANGRPTRRPGGDGDVLRRWPTNPVDGQCRTSDPSSVPPIAVAGSIRLGSHGEEPVATDRPIDGWTDRTASDGCVHSRPGQFVELNDVVGLGRPREGRGGSDRWKSSCVAVTATSTMEKLGSIDAGDSAGHLE